MKVKPSARMNKRYILISGERREIEKIILDYIGILGWAKASPVFLSGADGKVILSVNRKEIDNVRGAFELAGGKVKVLKVSGTLKGLGKI